MNTASTDQSRRQYWLRSLAWLALLAPLFFLSYGFANQQAAASAGVGSIFFEWEQHTPFVPWTIVPYWSIDLLYGLSFLLCRSPREIDRHALRLLTAQIISVACFLAFPLHFAFERPPVDGVFGTMFNVLTGFDRPYNQAPSLHISLLVIIWIRFAQHTEGFARVLVDSWALLIGVSVLTTYQHHFVDVPTGAAVGLICLWLWPDEGHSPLHALVRPRAQRQSRLAAFYLSGAALIAAVCLWFGGAALWGLWISLALLLTAIVYFSGDADGFQKTDGHHAFASRILFAPYRYAARLNAWLWTRRHSHSDHIAEGVWLGRHPDATASTCAVPGLSTLLDLCPELSAPRASRTCRSLPWLDLVVPTPAQLDEAAQAIESARHAGPLLVCCALGYSRSACAVVAWLYRTRRSTSIAAAIEHVRACRPHIVLSDTHLRALASLEAGS